MTTAFLSLIGALVVISGAMGGGLILQKRCPYLGSYEPRPDSNALKIDWTISSLCAASSGITYTWGLQIAG